MSVVNRTITRHWLTRAAFVTLSVVLPGAFAFSLAWLDDYLDRREYERERLS